MANKDGIISIPVILGIVALSILLPLTVNLAGEKANLVQMAAPASCPPGERCSCPAGDCHQDCGGIPCKSGTCTNQAPCNCTCPGGATATPRPPSPTSKVPTPTLVCTPGAWDSTLCARCNAQGSGLSAPGSDWGSEAANKNAWCSCCVRYSSSVNTLCYSSHRCPGGPTSIPTIRPTSTLTGVPTQRPTAILTQRPISPTQRPISTPAEVPVVPRISSTPRPTRRPIITQIQYQSQPAPCIVTIISGQVGVNNTIGLKCTPQDNSTPTTYRFSLIRDNGLPEILPCTANICSYNIPDYGCYEFTCQPN